MRLLNENVLFTISGGTAQDIPQAMQQLLAGAQSEGVSPDAFAQMNGYNTIGDFVAYVISTPR